MALDRLIPQLWSGRLQESLKNALIHAQEGVVNRDYEGEIQAFGDSVKIHGIGTVNVFDVTKNTDIPAPQTLTDSEALLVIDQQKGFNFQIDDIDAAQQNPKVMDAAMRESAYALRSVADLSIAGLYTQAAVGNTFGTDGAPLAVTPDNLYELLVDMDTRMDERNVPEDGRWVILPPFMRGMILKDKRFMSAFADEVIKNGVVTKVGGLTVLISNNVHATGANYHIMAGHRMAISYAEQIVKIEGYRPERRFADAVKGLHVYGRKVLRPEALVVATVAKPA